jgi:subtilisin family serine protease
MRALVALCLSAVVLPAFAQQRKPAARARLGPVVSATSVGRLDWLRVAASRVARPGVKAAGDAPSAPAQGGETFLVLNLEFDTPANCLAYAVAEAPAFTQVDRFADVFLPLSKIATVGAAIEKSAGLVRFEVAGRVGASPPPVAGKAAVRGEPDKIVRGGISGLTGKGVIVAVVDSGVDFRHQDFIRIENGKPVSRLLYLWDTTSPDFDAGKGGSAAPIRYPNGASVGTLFTRDQLTADLQAASSAIGDRDLNGHGTSCAGIAAGSGGADRRHIGVAPDADIIGVRIGGTPAGGLENSWVLNAACAWLDKVAGSQPLVVSCSFGGQNGRHDGRSIEEQQLNARFPAGLAGRAICVAAGNEGSDAIHADLTLGTAAKPSELKWKAGEGASLSLIFDTDDLSDVRFRAAAGTTLPKLSAKVDSATKQALVPVAGMGKGDGGMVIFTASGSAVKCDAYIDGGEFDKTCAAYSKLVGRPGTAAAAITVGSYDWNDRFEKDGNQVTVSPGGVAMAIGSLSSYSSVGPSRDSSVVKPDIVAPGQFYSAPVPLNATKGTRDTSNKYQLFNGTSAATPYVSGIIALVFQKKPGLTFGEVKRLIHTSASSDSFTGALPNPKWGYGKLDLAAVRTIIGALQ